MIQRCPHGWEPVSMCDQGCREPVKCDCRSAGDLAYTHEQTCINKTPVLAIVSESATHVAFINGPTYSRESILRAINSYKDLMDALLFVRQTVHQAHHENVHVTECRKNTCNAATQAIDKASCMKSTPAPGGAKL